MTRRRVPVRTPSRLTALVAALATLSAAPARADMDGGGAKELTGDAGVRGEGLVRIDGREAYLGLMVDGTSRDDLLRAPTFALTAGPHTLGLKLADGSTYEAHVLVVADTTAVVERTACVAPLGGVAPPIETRPRGCCGGGAPETARGYGALTVAALAFAGTRRRRKK